MNIGRNENPVKPGNCVLAFGIPLSVEGFLNAWELPPFPQSYVRAYEGGWKAYESSRFLVTFNRLKPEFDRLGASLRADITLDEFGNLFHDDRYSVITLFSHWDGDQVEFCGGFADIPAIVERAPADFDGVVDLCVCHPEPLVERLISRTRKYQVRYADRKTSPAFWLHFYHLLYAILLSREITYADALVETVREVFRQFGGVVHVIADDNNESEEP